MADNKGIIYEAKVNRLLREHKVQRDGFSPAGSNPNKPDAEIRVRGEDYFCEIKLDASKDFGQGSIDYDAVKQQWIIAGKQDDSGMIMREILAANQVMQIVNSETIGWGKHGAPRRDTVPHNLLTKADVADDKAKYKDIFVPIQTNSATRYYNAKKTYYIQIGKYGFYFMGKDIANLGVAQFIPKLQVRIRLKQKDDKKLHNYRFVAAIVIKARSLLKTNKSLDDTKFLEELATLKTDRE